MTNDNNPKIIVALVKSQNPIIPKNLMIFILL